MSSYDAIVIHWPEAAVLGRSERVQQLAHSGFVATLRRYRRGGGKVIWVFHNAQPHERKFLDLTGFAKQVDGIISPSKTGLDVAVKTYPFLDGLPQAIAYIGRYDLTPSTPAAKGAARKELGICPTATVAINCGGIRRFKGLEWPVNAYVDADPDENCLLIVGSGFYKSYVDEITGLAAQSPAIHIRGDGISHAELDLYLQASDIGVFTFSQTLHSSSVVTVRSMDLPVICSRVGSLPEYAAFDDGMVLIDTDEDLLGKVNLTASQWAKKPVPMPPEYDWSNIGENLNSFFNVVLADDDH